MSFLGNQHAVLFKKLLSGSPPTRCDVRGQFSSDFAVVWEFDITFNIFSVISQQSVIVWASTRENLSSGFCEQHRRRPACASTQSDQRLCYSLFWKATYLNVLQAKSQFSS